MPSPGGGSRGGGGSFGGGGGFRGNNFGGGSFGGGPRRPRYGYGYGFGFFPFFFGGGLFGILMLPVILVLLSVLLIVSTFTGAFGAIVEGGVIMHDTERIENYAYEQYEEIFDAGESYESNILIVFLVVDEHDNGEYYTLVGDDIPREIYMMFGGNGAELDQAMQASINKESYKRQLGRGIADVLDTMADHIVGNTEASELPDAEKYYKNDSVMELSDDTVKKAISEFSGRTGINIAIVVEDATDVLKVSYMPMIMGIVVATGMTVLAVLLIVKGMRARKRKNKNGPGNSGSGRNFYNESNNHYHYGF